MKKGRQTRKIGRSAVSLTAALAVAVSLLPVMPAAEAKAVFSGSLRSVTAVTKGSQDHIVMVTFGGGVQAKLTFLDDGIFRYNVDPSGEFSNYAAPVNPSHKARIQQYPDTDSAYKKPAAEIREESGCWTIKSGDVTVSFDKKTAKMTVKNKNKTVLQEKEPLNIGANATVQTLEKQEGEQFYGGGTQNGRFVHTGEVINIANESSWTDGGVASPNPFYYTTGGYGVLRNTFAAGSYDFGAGMEDAVRTSHTENEFDAYFFVSDGANGSETAQELLQDYFKVTGNPALLPEYAFYEGHLNAYNRDSWTDAPVNERDRGWTIKGTDSADSAGTTTYEYGQSTGYMVSPGMNIETLNGDKEPGANVMTTALGKFPANVASPYAYSARAVIDTYEKYDMPLGYFLPNDGYGAGYGQNGYYQTGGVNANGSSSAERLAAVAANVSNLKNFADYAKEKGVATGLWTQSYLEPDANPETPWHLLRDFRAEVGAGVSTLKTDVAWVGPGYSMQLDGVKTAYDIATSTETTPQPVRPNIISLDGWAGSQRYNGIWTGDQYGGNWEYIRFHIPTYIGTSLSGNPNVGSDMDGIFGGDAVISTRDYQWKIFTQEMLNMDGWGSYAKTPYTFGDPYTGINRMYLKMKSELMPYLYTTAYAASNLETGNGDQGLPMIRAMFLEYPEDAYTYSKQMQYQYLFGSSILVAPVYQDTEMQENGDDIRNHIYLPGKEDVWLDYFTGEQYRGGQVLNYFEAPLWKLPVFVKNGTILPKYEANNSAAKIDKTTRIVEFWPFGTTEYTAVEDDGNAVANTMTTDPEYGTIDHVDYGPHVSTKYTSAVNGTTAVLTAEKSSGEYDGYDAAKQTVFEVHVSKKPTRLTAKNGAGNLTMTEKTDKASFDAAVPQAGTAVWFYDAAPQIESYVPDQTKETSFQSMLAGVKTAPKLYVKFAKTDAARNAQTLTIEGFANDGNLPAEKENSSLAVPELKEKEAERTPNSITAEWNAAAGADSYELKIDGIVYSVGANTSYTLTDLAYASAHTWQVRARNRQTGYSAWSAEQTFTSAYDPWKDTPVPEHIKWTGTIYGGHHADRAFDREFQTSDGGFHSGENAIGETLTVDYGKAYEWDKIEYYPRDDAGNGTVSKMKLEISLDGVHWMLPQEYQWAADASVKTMSIGTAARYLRFTPLAAVGNFFSASEIKVYAKENSKGFAVGSTNKNAEVLEGDYTNMKNYLGMSVKDSSFLNQIQSRFGDLNYNGVYDVWDYAWTMFSLDGGNAQNGRVGGSASWVCSKENPAKGETFTITLRAEAARNVHALGQVAEYDPTKLEFVSFQKSDAIAGMENLSVNKVYADDTAYLNVAAANRGDKAGYSGSGDLVTITMKAKEAVSLKDKETIDLTAPWLIGADYSLVDGAGKSFGSSDFAVTITNANLPADDGANVQKLIANKSYAGLFDGKMGRDFEYAYSPVPEEATIPVTLHLTPKKAETINRIVLSNANKANGYVTSVTAVMHYADGTQKEKTKTLSGAEQVNYAAFEFVFEEMKPASCIDIRVNRAVDAANQETTTMLTLAELEVYQTGSAETADRTALAGKYEKWKDTVNIYTEESWNKFVMALAAAESALENPYLTQAKADRVCRALEQAAQALTERTKPDTTALQEKLDAYGAVQNTENKYAEAAWTAFQAALAQAETLLRDAHAEQSKVDAAVAELEQAYRMLLASEQKPDDQKPNDQKPDDQKPDQNKKELKPGDIREAGSLRYRVTGADTTEAVGLTAKGAKQKKVKIPATVKLEGKTFQVTAVGAKAFRKNPKMMSVVIGKNVVKIGGSAFAGCKKLKSIVIKSKKFRQSGKNVWKGISKKAVVKVPKAKLKAYQKLLKKGKLPKTAKVKK